MTWSFSSIADYHAALRRNETSVAEAVTGSFRALTELNGTLNMFLSIAEPTSAIRAARIIDEQLSRGAPFGPLTGVPVAIKDVFDVRGLPTTAGSKVFAQQGPAVRDSEVVRRLRRAGAIPIGKTHTHELSWGATSNNAFYGPARNPHDATRIPGGSSGGSAIAVASGVCPVAIGSDTAGSTRIPAALSGCIGFKPQIASELKAGMIGMTPRLDSIGILGTSTDDIVRVHSSLALDECIPPEAMTAETPMRVARLSGWFDELLDEQDATAFAALTDQLQEHGMTIKNISVPDLGALPWAIFTLISKRMFRTYGNIFLGSPELFSTEVGEHLRAGEPSVTEVSRALSLLDTAASFLSPLLGRYDCLLTPTVPMRAPSIGQTQVLRNGMDHPVGRVLTRNTGVFNYLDVPAISVPLCEHGERLPIGVQLVAHPTAQSRLFALASLIERVRVGQVSSSG